MELAIIKREIIGDNAQNETETVAKYEIMDGAPVKGESIPIRLFLGGYDLTPTMRDVQKKFSCKYYLNLVLVDEEERRYFKQQEIILWRKADKYKSKQERSDQMQVYESAQEQQKNQTNSNIMSGANQASKGGMAKNSNQKVRHDENGDLLNNGEEENDEDDEQDDDSINDEFNSNFKSKTNINNNTNKKQASNNSD